MVDKVAFIFDSSFPESLSVCQSEEKADFELVSSYLVFVGLWMHSYELFGFLFRLISLPLCNCSLSLLPYSVLFERSIAELIFLF